MAAKKVPARKIKSRTPKKASVTPLRSEPPSPWKTTRKAPLSGFPRCSRKPT